MARNYPVGSIESMARISFLGFIAFLARKSPPGSTEPMARTDSLGFKALLARTLLLGFA